MLVQKDQLTQCIQQIWVVGTITFSAKRSTHTVGHTVEAVCSGHSRIVVYGGGDIVFGAKMANQRTQYAVDAVRSVCSGIVVYGGGDIVFWCKKVKPVDVVDAVHSGHSTQ